MRNIRKNSWCWQSKDLTRFINAHYRDARERCSIRSLYQVLTEIASDKNTDQFKEFMVVIADNAGVSRQTASRLLKSLSSFGIIKYRVREKDRNRYGKTEFELFDVPELEAKGVYGLDRKSGESMLDNDGTSSSEKPLEPQEIEQTLSKIDVANLGYIKSPVKSLDQIISRINDESLKKTLSSDEVKNILSGLENLSTPDLLKLSGVLNKNQLGNIIFEGYIAIANIQFIKPVEKDRSRHYKQYVKSIQSIVEYLLAENTELTIKDIIEKLVAWANTGLSWNLNTVYKHIEKTPEDIIKMCNTNPKKVIKPPKFFLERTYEADVTFGDE